MDEVLGALRPRRPTPGLIGREWELAEMDSRLEAAKGRAAVVEHAGSECFNRAVVAVFVSSFLSGRELPLLVCG
jgi:hypothetical protein